MVFNKIKNPFISLLIGGVSCLAAAINLNQKEVVATKAESYSDTTIAKSDVYDFKAWGNGRLPSESGLPKSSNYDGIVFTGRYATYTNADTFYLSEDTDGVCYSSYTDGHINGQYAGSPNPRAAKIIGDDPLNLSVTAVGDAVTHTGEGGMFQFGRYPAGNLMYNGVWYYGTYLLEWTDRALDIPNSDWQSLQPFVGFRYSYNKGVSWEDNTNPNAPLFEYPHEKEIIDLNGNLFFNEKEILIGAPHFVDFGMNLEYAPVDPVTNRKYAYMVAHGADAGSVIAHNSWVSGDNVYLLRVLMPEKTPAENAVYLNNYENWEYYCGESGGAPVYRKWNKKNIDEVYNHIKPIVHSTGYLGNVAVTYNPILNKYFMTLSRAMKADRFDSIILESDTLNGGYRVIQYLEKFAQVSYFMNIPSKFISADGKTMWLCYSSNYQGQKANIAGSSYSMCLREIRLVKDDAPLTLSYEAESMRLIGEKPNVMENNACSDGLMVGNIYAKDSGVAITNLISDGDTLAFTYAHGGTYVNQATVFVNGVEEGKIRLKPTGSWQKFATALFYGSFCKGDTIEIKLLEDDINQNKLYGAYDEDGNYIVDGNYRILADIDKVSVMRTLDKTKILQGSADIENRWGVYEYGDGVAGFARGNSAEASDTLKEFQAPVAGEYRIVFNYFASDYPSANPTKRWLNFLVNGRRHLVELPAVGGNWNFALSKQFYVTLKEGKNIIKLQGEFGPDSCVNADNVQIYDASSSLLIKLEAEEGTLLNTGIPTPGVVAGFEGRFRPTMDLKVNVPSSGYYTLLMEYASWQDGGNNDAYRYLDIGANVEGKADAFKEVKFHRTNDWSHYATESVILFLEAGDNVVTFVGSHGLGSSINLRKVTITNDIVAGTVSVTAEKSMVAVGEEIVPVLNTNPVDGIFDSVSYSIINVTGEAQKQADGKIIATKKGDVIIRFEIAIGEHVFIRELQVFIGLLHYEAENAVLGGPAFITNIYPGYSGTGFVAGFDQPSNPAMVTFATEVEKEGHYKLAIRYSAGPLSGGSLDHRDVAVYVNGVRNLVRLELTNGWAEWKTGYLYCSLREGANSIAIVKEMDTNDDCINLDYIEILDLSKDDKAIVHFVDASGSEIYSQDVVIGSKASKPEDPAAPAGYEFDGWYSDEGLTQKFDFDSTIENETFVYAKFVALPTVRTVTLHIGEGTTILTVEDGGKISIPDPEAPEGYRFAGWFSDSDYLYRFDLSSPITKDVHLYALFEKLPEKGELNSAIEECEKLNPNDYESGFEQFKLALEGAKEVARNEGATQSQIDQALVSLLEAKGNLKPKAPQNSEPWPTVAIVVSSVLAASSALFLAITLANRKKKIS